MIHVEINLLPPLKQNSDEAENSTNYAQHFPVVGGMDDEIGMIDDQVLW